MPRPESSKSGEATKILEDGGTVDDLPLDEETALVTNQHILFAEFLAYIRDSRITVGGEIHITIAVPYEHKYDALPLTDMRGVMFIMQCHRPMSEREIAWRKEQGDMIEIGDGGA